MLTLSEAQRLGRIDEFIAQEEARGIGPIDRAAFDVLLGKAIKGPRSKDRTSRSASGGGLRGKKTPQGNDPCASD
jgi:hypothetical protein